MACASSPVAQKSSSETSSLIGAYQGNHTIADQLASHYQHRHHQATGQGGD